MPCSDPALVSDPRPAFKLSLAQRFPGASQVIQASGHATISEGHPDDRASGLERCESMSSGPNFRVSSGAHALPHAGLSHGVMVTSVPYLLRSSARAEQRAQRDDAADNARRSSLLNR